MGRNRVKLGQKPRVLAGTFLGTVACYALFVQQYSNLKDEKGTHSLIRCWPGPEYVHMLTLLLLVVRIFRRGLGVVWNPFRRTLWQGLFGLVGF